MRVDYQHHGNRAADVLARLPDRATLRGAEVGVCRGQLAAALLQRHPGLSLYLVDAWGMPCRHAPTARQDRLSRRVADNPEAYLSMARRLTDFASDRRAFMLTDSACGAALIPDGSLDFAYIDANHTQAGVTDDLRAWAPKVAPGGLLCGHDYGLIGGVTQAVDTFCAAQGLAVEAGVCSNWFARIPA